ncbi:MAG: tetraacyldisaccharide 4'-kinase [Alphaproteobacteria bacterium]|nr:tetraacyldisaccharide 4'-kinase [Alphaproteobacteria bacterium]
MKFHAPHFWFTQHSSLATLLLPLSFLYNQAGKLLRAQVTPQKMSVPVICVGNILVGGSGKTPLVRTLAKTLQQLGFLPHIISRGYGGYLRGPLRVDPAIHTLGEVGDEPLLLSAIAPVWVAKDKVAGAKAAIAAGATHIILDDGLQNPSLHKDIIFLVIDATRGLGNGHVLPAGPLRETLDDALAKTSAVIWIGNGDNELKKSLNAKKKLIEANAKTFCTTHDLSGQKLFAFCGLGNAQKFYDGVRELGANIIKTADFPDHYVWSAFEIEMLLNEAKTLSALPVTTAKDAMRIPQSLGDQIAICDVAITLDEIALQKLITP